MISTSHRRQRRSRRRPIAPPRAWRRARPTYEPLRVQLERRPDVVLLRVSGEFDLGGVGRVERSFERAVGARAGNVVFDLRGVNFLDVCGLETLLRANARARDESFGLAVLPPRGLAARIFAVTDAGLELTLLDDL